MKNFTSYYTAIVFTNVDGNIYPDFMKSLLFTNAFDLLKLHQLFQQRNNARILIWRPRSRGVLRCLNVARFTTGIDACIKRTIQMCVNTVINRLMLLHIIFT